MNFFDFIQHPFIVSIHPNPIKDKLNVSIKGEFESGVLNIRNNEGEILHSENLINKNVKINLENLYNGIYNLEIKSSTHELKRMLVKE
jgi:hypothetical protein